MILSIVVLVVILVIILGSKKNAQQNDRRQNNDEQNGIPLNRENSIEASEPHQSVQSTFDNSQNTEYVKVEATPIDRYRKTVMGVEKNYIVMLINGKEVKFSCPSLEYYSAIVLNDTGTLIYAKKNKELIAFDGRYYITPNYESVTKL